MHPNVARFASYGSQVIPPSVMVIYQTSCPLRDEIAQLPTPQCGVPTRTLVLKDRQ